MEARKRKTDQEIREIVARNHAAAERRKEERKEERARRAELSRTLVAEGWTLQYIEACYYLESRVAAAYRIQPPAPGAPLGSPRYQVEATFVVAPEREPEPRWIAREFLSRTMSSRKVLARVSREALSFSQSGRPRLRPGLLETLLNLSILSHPSAYPRRVARLCRYRNQVVE